MPIVRKRLKPSDVYPEDIRYNSTSGEVERLINDVWTPAPESDPRNQTTFPPRVSTNPRCDGAQSVADALQNQINSINTAIDGAQTVAQIAALVLALFSFGVFAIFINIALAIANLMLDTGTAAIEAALPPSAYDTLACILFCHMDANGRLESLSSVQTEVTDQIGGVGAVILNQMLSLAGEGGINNLAAIGESSGDCDGCGCSECECDLAAWTWIAGLNTPEEANFERHVESCSITADYFVSGGYAYWGIESPNCCTLSIDGVGPAGGYDFIGVISCDYTGEYSVSNESVGWLSQGSVPVGVPCKAVMLRFHDPATIFAHLP